MPVEAPPAKPPISPAKLAANRRNALLAGAPRKSLNKRNVFHALAQDGFTVKEIAKDLGFPEGTCWRWMKEDRGLREAYKKGRAAAIGRVVDAMQSRAVGMTLPETDLHVVDKTLVRTELTKHFLPDTLAGIFFLKNRDPANWADRQEIHQTTTIAGLPAGVMERMRTLARARSFGHAQVVDVEAKALPEPYWNYEGV